MDQPITSESVLTQPPVSESEPIKKPFLKWLFVLVIGFLLGGASVFAWQRWQPTGSVLVASSPSPAVSPESVDLTADWKTYENKTAGISFKYPNDWELNTKDENGDERQENIKVKLIKDQAEIGISSNIVGIGGQGQAYTGIPVIVDGVNLYRFEKEFNNMIHVGLTDSLTESLGVFQVNKITYDIALKFPVSYSSNEIIEAIEVFDQILSTFKFTESGVTAGGKPCQYNGKTYQDGETFPDECNSCSCESGQIACTTMACL